MAADTASTIAQAVGQVAGTITSLVNKAAQRYGFQKGMETEGVSYERSKKLELYGAFGAQQSMQTYLLMAGIISVAVLLMFKRKSNA
jgi:hypothetical protein